VKRPEWAQFYRQRRRDYNEVFGSEAGKRVLRDLMRQCGWMVDSHARTPSDTEYNVGKRYPILYIFGAMKMTEQQVEQMAIESERIEIEQTERGLFL
jgi:hypothetical protein